jgi:hypothetical protein
MHNSDYYREQAAHYRELAEGAKDAAAKQEFLELAAACEEAADKMEPVAKAHWSVPASTALAPSRLKIHHCFLAARGTTSPDARNQPVLDAGRIVGITGQVTLQQPIFNHGAPQAHEYTFR